MSLDTDPQLFLAETYGSKPKLESEKIDLNKIDLEIQPLTEVLNLINRQRYSAEEFSAILQKINLAIETFGLEKFQADYLTVNNEVLSGRIEFKDLSQNLQDLLHYGFYCLQRLKEHLPEIWKDRKAKIDLAWNGQVVENHGQVLVEIYLNALDQLGNPEISREVMQKILSELISAVKSTFAYKFVPTEPHQVIYDRNITFLKDTIASYIQELIKNS